jgi:hypothetical protein
VGEEDVRGPQTSWFNPRRDSSIHLHDEKVLDLLRQSPLREKDNPRNHLEDLLGEGRERLGEKASPKKLLEAMKQHPSWQRKGRVLLRYLVWDKPSGGDQCGQEC